jgi:hypothetical protein
LQLWDHHRVDTRKALSEAMSQGKHEVAAGPTFPVEGVPSVSFLF